MKKLFVLMMVCVVGMSCYAQNAKSQAKKNLVIKEWNRSDAGKGSPVLDHVTTFNAEGRKIEEIEYNAAGLMKARCTFEYDADGRLSRSVIYDDRNKPVRIRKYEYNEDGTKKKQYSYAPNGKLQSVKEYEYVK